MRKWLGTCLIILMSLLSVSASGFGQIIENPTRPKATNGRRQMLARIRGDRLYAVQEKPSGFKRLAVYRMIWK